MVNRMKRLGSTVLIAAMTSAAFAGCDKKEVSEPADKPGTATQPAAPAKPQIDKAQLAAFAPLPEVMSDTPLNEAHIELGRMLYFDKRLSKNQDISCNTCHDLQKYGIDPREKAKTSSGHKNQTGTRNSPTVYNAAGHFRQFWDGRAADVEEQAKGPILNPVEMAMPDEKYVLRVLNSIPGYVEAFKKTFPDDKQPLNYDNVGKAVGAFERKLVTPSRWDKFLKGDEAALSDAEKEGFLTFVSTGCVTCHTGAYLGGHMYQKAGLVKPWPEQSDQGRYEVTKQESDKMMFKVPSLRNITKTAPYFHDGSSSSLPDAIRKMAEFQLGKSLKDDEVKSMMAFFESLTGEVPTDYIKEPELPPSGPTTPKPIAD